MPTIPLSIDPAKGACVEILVGSRKDDRGVIGDRRKKLALIDTGAGVSFIDNKLVEEMRLNAVDSAEILSPTTEGDQGKSQPTYNAFIAFHHVGMQGDFPQLRVVGADLAGQGVDLILGRDALRFVTFWWDGTAERLCLCF